MHRQAGDLKLNSQGIAEQGLIIRHLVLPGNLAGTDKIINFIAELSTNTYFNLMDQYRPEFHAREFPGIRNRVPLMEFQEFRRMAIKRGLKRLAR
jgi:putative pyruvate formate lyase activating enzyme